LAFFVSEAGEEASRAPYPLAVGANFKRARKEKTHPSFAHAGVGGYIEMFASAAIGYHALGGMADSLTNRTLPLKGGTASVNTKKAGERAVLSGFTL
jgi:hypothetical protein